MLVMSFQAAGLDEQRLAFNRFGKGVRSPFTATPWGREIGEDFLKIEQQQFDSQGARGGKPWAALSAAYAASKAVRYPGRKILQATGAMEAAYTSRAGGHREVIKPDSIELGVNEHTFKRARWHQLGTRNMPARPPIAITAKDRLRWMKLGQKHLVALYKQGAAGTFT